MQNHRCRGALLMRHSSTWFMTTPYNFQAIHDKLLVHVRSQTGSDPIQDADGHSGRVKNNSCFHLHWPSVPPKQSDDFGGVSIRNPFLMHVSSIRTSHDSRRSKYRPHRAMVKIINSPLPLPVSSVLNCMVRAQVTTTPLEICDQVVTENLTSDASINVRSRASRQTTATDESDNSQFNFYSDDTCSVQGLDRIETRSEKSQTSLRSVQIVTDLYDLGDLEL